MLAVVVPELMDSWALVMGQFFIYEGAVFVVLYGVVVENHVVIAFLEGQQFVFKVFFYVDGHDVTVFIC